MSLSQKLTDDMKAAMKSGEKVRLLTIRQIRAQIKDAQIAKGEELDDEAIMAVINNAAKKRKDAIDMYTKGGRTDLVESEEAELAVIQDYLPKQLSEQEVADIVAAAAEETGAQGPADFGKVMKVVMAKVKGLADGKLVQQLVKDRLN